MLLFGAAGWVGYVNTTSSNQRIVFPLLDRVARDPDTQGWITLGILASLATIALVLALRQRAD